MERKDAIKVIDRMLVSIAFSDQKIAIGRPEEVKEALRYALDSLKTDEMYNLLAETPPDIFENWIPVFERLPDNNVRVLCSAISTSISGGYTRFVGCCDNGDWFVQTDAETVSYPRQYKVTAWMPLPEPYNADREVSE